MMTQAESGGDDVKGKGMHEQTREWVGRMSMTIKKADERNQGRTCSEEFRQISFCGGLDVCPHLTKLCVITEDTQ
jgi:hypothetical protein